MGLFRKAKKLAQQSARRIYPLSTLTSGEKLRANYRPRDIAATEFLQRAIGVVHDCASTNASVCSQQPLRLMRRVEGVDPSERRAYGGRKASKSLVAYMKSGRAGIKAGTFADAAGEVEEVLDHPMLDLLARPNPEFPGAQLAWLSFYYREITGKAYEMIGWDDNGQPSLLFPMPPQFVNIVYSDDGISGYRYARGDGMVADLEPIDVVYYKHNPSRFNPYEGEGPLVGVIAEADLLVSNLMHDIASVRNGNQMGGVVSVNDPMVTPEQLDEFERRLKAKHGGNDRAGELFVTKGNVTVSPLQWPEKELQSIAKQDFYEKRIRAAFGHTESMADSNASTYASALVGYDHQYMGSAIRPRLLMDAAQKTEFLCDLFGLDPTVYMFVYDDPVVKDEASLREQTRQDVAAGIITINEARSERGIDESDDEGAEALRINGQKLETLDTQPSQIGGGLDIPSIFRSADTGTAAVKSRKDAASAFIFKGMIDDELPEWRVCGCATKDDDDIAPEPLIEQVYRDYLKETESAMESAVREMQDEVVDAVRNGRPSDLDPLRERVAQSLREQMKEIVDAGVRFTLEAANQDIESMFEVAQTSALEFLDRHVIQVADDIADTTDSMIRPAIQRGLDEGLSIDQISREMDGLPKWRAERIARTEVQNAAQGSRYETFKEIGVEEVEWVTAPGASKAHQAIAARGRRKVGEPFVKAGEVLNGEKFSRDVYYPPARPNCRCSIRAIHDTSGGDE